MKKSLAFLLVAILTLVALVSCGGDDSGDHTHTFSTEWKSDDDNHWHAATCEHIDEKSDLAAHVDANEDGKCDVCDSKGHEHTFSVAWISSDTKHWREATCSHTELKVGEAAHVDENEDGRCDVCMYDGLHHHTFNTATWVSDETGHWHKATCAGHGDRKGNFQAHVTAENDGVCDVCGYAGMHIHTFSDTDWEKDDTNHWRPANCGHDDEKFNVEEHYSSANNGVCDTCGQTGLHIHEISDTEYESDALGHWHKTDCGHDYVYDFESHVDTDTDNFCDTCAKKLRYTVSVVVTQPDRVTLVGADEQVVDIGSDIFYTVKVDSEYVLAVTTGGGEIFGIPTTNLGITTYTVKVTQVSDDTTLTLVAKYEDAYDMSTLVPVAPESNQSTKTVYRLDNGSFSLTNTSGTKYDITYVNQSTTTYDAAKEIYKVEKIAKIVSIKDAEGNETTLTHKGITYGSSGEDVTTVIPTRHWLFEDSDSRNFGLNHETMSFNPATSVYAEDPDALCVFETNVLIEGNASGAVFEFYFINDGGGAAATTSVSQSGNSITVMPLVVGAGWTGNTDVGVAVGTTFNFRVEVTESADASKMDVTLYINGVYHSSCTIDKINNFRANLFLREDGLNRNSTVTFTDTRFVKYIEHTHTFNTDEWVSDETGHWHAATCEHDVKADYAEHDSATNNGVCDVCGEENIHVHTFSNTEYAYNSEGHWYKANCGHNEYIFGLEPHEDGNSDGFCDACNVRLNYTVNVVITQPEKVTLVGDSVIPVAIGDDLTLTVKVNSRFILYVTTGGGVITDVSTEGGITTYAVKLSNITDDITLTLVAKLENEYNLSTLPTTEATTKTVTVYKLANGSFSLDDTTGTKYDITYVNAPAAGYDAATGAYTIEKIATIVSIKDASGAETTLEHGGVTYGASGEDVKTTIPTRNWLFESTDSRNFWCSHSSMAFNSTGVNTDDDSLIYCFETDILVSTVGKGTAFELYLSYGSDNYLAKTALRHDADGILKISPIVAGSGESGFVECAELGTKFNLRIEIAANATDTTKLDATLYINDVFHSTCTVEDKGDVKVRLVLREDGADRNTTVSFSDTRFVKYILHTHTFDTEVWEHNESGHWNPSTCGHSTAKGNFAEHSSAENNGICDVCGEENIHVHTFSDDEYGSNIQGHWFKTDCGHEYVAEILPHEDGNSDDLCDTCGKSLNCRVTVDFDTTFALIVTDPDTLNGAPGTDITFQVSAPATHTVVASGAEIVGEPTENAGIKTYTLKVAAIEDDTTVTVYTKRVSGSPTLSSAEATTNTVTIFENNGAFATMDNGGSKYVITYVNNTERIYDDVTGTLTFNKVAKIISIKDANNAETTLAYGDKIYGAFGEGVTNVIPARNWLFESDDSKRNFVASGGDYQIFAPVDSTMESLYHFEADFIIEHSDVSAGVVELSLHQSGTGSYQAMMAINAIEGKIQIVGFGKGASLGANVSTEINVGEVFNLAIDIVGSADASGERDLIISINGEEVTRNTYTGIDFDGRLKFILRDDGADRNSVITMSNVYLSKKS